VKRLTLTGSTLRPRTAAFKAELAHALRTQIWPQFESGALRTHVFKTFDWRQASEAHALMESSVHIGKIMLKVG
jgi:NADPH:quinone reductase